MIRGKRSGKEEIIEFIKKNPKTTYKGIRQKTKLHPERYFKSLKEAFIEAGIKPPRTYEIKSKEEKRKIVIDYIKKHPKAGGHTIRKDTKINLPSVFKSTEEAYKEAGVEYPRKSSYKLSPNKKRELIIKTVKENPYITVIELTKKLGVHPHKLFKNMMEIYEKAGVKKVSGGEKRKTKKIEDVIDLIKDNPLATQREINNACKTHVQELFGGGIFEAYEKANMKFPYERLKLYGTTLKNIRQRAKTFEEQIALRLSGYGNVNRLVKTKRGFADVILERKGKKIIIEIKDYQAKDISISQVKQLNKYLEDCNCDLGILICHKKPKKDKFLIGKNKIFILEKQELFKIPTLI